METLYDTLKVSEDAPIEVIRAAYKTLASKYHPDKNPGDAGAAAMMQRLNNAYRILSNAETRARYDESLHRSRSEPPISPTPPAAPEAPEAPSSVPQPKKATRPQGSFQFIWLPLIIGAISVRLLGALGAAALIVVYYWLQPRMGTVIATLASVISGIAATTAITFLLAPPAISNSANNLKTTPANYSSGAIEAGRNDSIHNPIQSHSSEIDKFLSTPPQTNENRITDRQTEYRNTVERIKKSIQQGYVSTTYLASSGTHKNLVLENSYLTALTNEALVWWRSANGDFNVYIENRLSLSAIRAVDLLYYRGQCTPQAQGSLYTLEFQTPIAPSGKALVIFSGIDQEIVNGCAEIVRIYR